MVRVAIWTLPGYAAALSRRSGYWRDCWTYSVKNSNMAPFVNGTTVSCNSPSTGQRSDRNGAVLWQGSDQSEGHDWGWAPSASGGSQDHASHDSWRHDRWVSALCLGEVSGYVRVMLLWMLNILTTLAVQQIKITIVLVLMQWVHSGSGCFLQILQTSAVRIICLFMVIYSGDSVSSAIIRSLTYKSKVAKLFIAYPRTWIPLGMTHVPHSGLFLRTLEHIQLTVYATVSYGGLLYSGGSEKIIVYYDFTVSNRGWVMS